MFDELTKYKDKDHFFLVPEASLADICNAPTDKAGIYIVYGLSRGKIDMLYIGSSGRKDEDGIIENRAGGLKDKIINGKHAGGSAASIAWPLQMIQDGIEALDIYWYVTFNDKHSDCPTIIKAHLLRKYKNIYGNFPRWNKAG